MIRIASTPRAIEPMAIAAVAVGVCGCEARLVDQVELVPWQEIVFVRQEESRSVLMTVAPDGSGLGVIRDAGRAPRVSADGRRLYFLDDGPWLFVEGENAPERLDLLALAWSPTGARLAARTWDDDVSGDDLWIHDFDTGVRVQASHGRPVQSAVWAPDGNRLAYVDSTPELWIVDLRQGEPRAVARANDGEIFVSWSPDSRRIVYGMGSAIYIDDLAARGESRVASTTRASTTRRSRRGEGSFVMG